VQALSAAASTSRFGLQPPSAAVVTLPAGLSVRSWRADVVEVCCCRGPVLHFADDLTLVRRVLPPRPIACLQAREYSASAIPRDPAGVSAGGGNGVSNDEPAAAAPVGTKTRVLWVQQVGAKDYAKLATSAADVGDLKEDIVKKLPSLRDVDTDSITLQLAVQDAGGKDKLVALDSMDTIDEALTKALGGAATPTAKLRIIVDAAASAAGGVFFPCNFCMEPTCVTAAP
jgi:hypothetical protein